MMFALFIFKLVLGLRTHDSSFFILCAKNSSSSRLRSSMASTPQHASAGNKRLTHFHKPFLLHSTCAQEKEGEKNEKRREKIAAQRFTQAVGCDEASSAVEFEWCTLPDLFYLLCNGTELLIRLFNLQHRNRNRVIQKYGSLSYDYAAHRRNITIHQRDFISS